MEIALIEGVTVALAREMIDDAEINGDIVRDDGECVIQDGDPNDGGFASTGLGGVGEAGVKWWPNVFIDYVWDGQKFDAEYPQIYSCIGEIISEISIGYDKYIY